MYKSIKEVGADYLSDIKSDVQEILLHLNSLQQMVVAQEDNVGESDESTDEYNALDDLILSFTRLETQLERI